MDYKQIAQQILESLGGKENFQSYENCMTRLRVYLIDNTKINKEQLQQIEGVLGIVEGDQFQIILGPGHAGQVKIAIDNFAETNYQTFEQNLTTDDKKIPSTSPTSLSEKVKSFCQKIGSIFVPIMPYFIVYGFLALIPAYLSNSSGIFYQFFQNLQSLLFLGLIILIAYQSAKTFEANPIYNVLLAIIAFTTTKSFTESLLVTFPLLSYMQNGITLTILLTSMFLPAIERFWQKHLPNLLSFYLLPVLTILTGSLLLIIILPVTALVMTAIIWFILFILLEKLGILGGLLLSLFFLPTVLLGIHQVLYPLHIQLILQTGANPLFSILATAGAGQLGAAIALSFIEKNKNERTKILKVIPASLLGMNEQLIYSVTHPRGKPFMLGCFGGAIGGAFLGYLYWQGEAVVTTTIGPSGLLLLPFILDYKWLYYILTLLLAYGGGMILTLLFGRKNKETERIADNGKNR